MSWGLWEVQPPDGGQMQPGPPGYSTKGRGDPLPTLSASRWSLAGEGLASSELARSLLPDVRAAAPGITCLPGLSAGIVACRRLGWRLGALMYHCTTVQVYYNIPEQLGHIQAR